MNAINASSASSSSRSISDRAVQRLLLQVGFRTVLWPAPLGPEWSVVGELDGGLRIVVACMRRGTGRYRLHVTPAAARDWLCELLQHHRVTGVAVTSEPIDRVSSPTPWLAVSVGAGAIALFGWVLSAMAR